MHANFKFVIYLELVLKTLINIKKSKLKSCNYFQCKNMQIHKNNLARILLLNPSLKKNPTSRTSIVYFVKDIS